MLFISFCTEDCNVELTIFPLFLEDIILSITWGDIFGKLGGAVGKGSLLASCNSVLSISPTKCNRSNKRFLLAISFVNFLHNGQHGKVLLMLSLAAVLTMMFGWFRCVAKESMSGLYNKQMDYSFRWSMTWFIFSEVFFFLAFFRLG